MTMKRLDFDQEHNEFIVNGNRISKESLLNLLAVGLFVNLNRLAINSGDANPNDVFTLALSPDDFEKWLFFAESDGATLLFQYSPKDDIYLLNIASKSYEGKNETNETEI